jgi:hypothetical protein
MKGTIALGLVLLASGGVSVTAKDLSEYSLRVTILQVRWQDGSFGPSGEGRGNVDDGETRRGFDFTFACSRRFNATTGTDFYQGKWKKPETRLAIIMVEIGNTNHQSECELKTTVKNFAYVMTNGGLATTPIGRRAPQQQTPKQVPRRAGTVQELIGRAETEVRTALGEPFRIDGPRWTYQTTTGQVYLYVGGGLVTDVQPPTAMVNSIVRSAPASNSEPINKRVPDVDPAHYPLAIHVLGVEWRDESTGAVAGTGRGNILSGLSIMAFNFSGACEDRFTTTEAGVSYKARWNVEPSRLIVLGRNGRTCELKTETRPTDVYVRNTTTGVVTAFTQEQFKARLEAAKTAAQTQPAASSSSSGQSAAKAAAKLTNGDVISMVALNLTPAIILAKIEASDCAFDTSPEGLRQLKAARVPDAIVLEMIKRSK